MDTDIAFPNLGIYLSNVPQSFTIFGFTIYMYGMIIGVGAVLGILLVAKQAKKQGIDPDMIYELALWLLVFGIIGARLYYVIFRWQDYKYDIFSVFNIRNGGLAIYGGVIAGTITLCIYCKLKKLDLKKVGDIAFQGVLVGQIIGRWGNFTNREVFGDYTNNLFAMRLPVNAVRQSDISDNIRAHMSSDMRYIQVHPTFLYESFANLVLLTLIYFFQKKKAFDGECILWYAGGYGIIRFVIEGIRTDRLTIGNSGIAVSQMLGIFLFVMSIIVDVVIRVKMNNKKLDESKKAAK